MGNCGASVAAKWIGAAPKVLMLLRMVAYVFFRLFKSSTGGEQTNFVFILIYLVNYSFDHSFKCVLLD